MDDYDHVVELLKVIGADLGAMHVITIPWEPHAKMRHQHSLRGRHIHTYPHPKDVRAEHRAGSFFRAKEIPQFTGNVAVAGIFYRSSREVADVDNCLKHVGDAGNGILWKDDSQITAMAGVVHLDPESPRSLLAFARHPLSSLKRGTDHVGYCLACGESFFLEGRSPDQKFCGVGCSARGRRKDFVPHRVMR